MRRCPMCNSTRVTSSHRRGFWESFVLPLMFRRPFGCRECHHRFYGFSFGKRTRRRMGLVLLILLLAMSTAWGVWRMIDALTTPRPPQEAPPEPPR